MQVSLLEQGCEELRQTRAGKRVMKTELKARFAAMSEKFLRS